jgi:hypothetical protein
MPEQKTISKRNSVKHQLLTAKIFGRKSKPEDYLVKNDSFRQKKTVLG